MPKLNRRALMAGAVVTIAAASFAFTLERGAAAAGKPAIGTWGFDLASMDRLVDPGDDFFHYVNGTWLKSTQIPPDRASWGSFQMLGAKAEEDTRTVVMRVASTSQKPGSIEQKVADFYNSYLDTKTIDALGLKPFEGDLAMIAGLKTHEDVARAMGRTDIPTNGPIGVGFGIDQKKPDRYSIDVAQGGLGLPDRDYYLKPDQKFAETRAAYRGYVEKMLTLAHYANAAANADAILALEIKMAEVQWPLEKRRDLDLTYNPKTWAELKAFAGEFPWDDYFQPTGFSLQTFFVLDNPEPVAALAKIFRATPVETWRAYLTFHYLNGQADIMPTAFDDASFEFNGKVITGQQQKRDRWKRAVLALTGQYGGQPLAEAVGQLYVHDNFTPQAKAEVKELVDNILAAYRAHMANLDWMSAETRAAAMRKVNSVRIKIGFPDKWRDYATLEVKPGDAYGNRQRTLAWDWKRQASRMMQTADKAEWGMAPQTVNAYYNAQWNEIVFPAAILHAPFFDPNADPAINYGAIGGVIGHEMGHGFDDQGAKSDENGVLHTWWNQTDIDRFKVKTTALAAQYSSYEPLPGLHVNGVFTSGENMGDLGGLTIGYAAYQIHMQGKKAPVLDGFTGEQRVFLGWGQVWRSLYRDEALRAQVTSNVHSPAQYCCNGVVRNVDGWYDAFNIKPGTKLYLAPQERVHIW